MNKNYLLKDRNLARVKKYINEAGNVFLFLDYDGTLAPFNPLPEEAYALENSVEMLKKFSKTEKYKLSFVSGRKLSGLQQMIEIENANYAGSHGLEVKLVYEEQITYPFQKNNLDQKSSTLYQKTKEKYEIMADVKLEDKGFGIALHCSSEEQKNEIAARLKADFADSSYQVLAGRKLVEIRPEGWDKGKAVEYISEKIKEYYNIEDYLSIYIGDDRTDEDAFKVIESGISIYVKNDDNLKTAADYYLNDPEDTAKLLVELAGDL
ncbi:MAG: trehalose-phosphatase [Halanaerobium sp.]